MSKNEIYLIAIVYYILKVELLYLLARPHNKNKNKTYKHMLTKKEEKGEDPGPKRRNRHLGPFQLSS